MRIYILQKNGSHIPLWRKFLMIEILEKNLDSALAEYNASYITDFFDPASDDPTGTYIEFASKEDYVEFMLKWG